MKRLDGAVVAVTGGARGIGRATAAALERAGALAAVGDLDGDAYPLDVTDPSSFASFLDAVEADHGPLYALVNNAGIMLTGTFTGESPERAARMVDVNLNGVITGSRLACARFLERGRGHLVNVASVAGKAGFPGGATYCATKHAVVGFNESLYMELRQTGVNITTVMPSLAATSLSAGMAAPRGLPMIDPEDIATAIVRAIERPRLEVYIPRRLNGMFRTRAFMTRGMQDLTARVFRSDRIGIEVDVTERSRGYMDRAAKTAEATASAENEQIAEAAKRE